VSGTAHCETAGHLWETATDRPRYHTQSPEALFTHTPGLRVVIPRSPIQAKGLLLSAIQCNDPVIFMEPKILYRAAVEQVPVGAYHLPLDKAEVIKSGNHVTIISYGTPLYTCSAAIAAAEKDFGCSVELIDLRTIYPWDRETILNSVKKTGRAIVVHESMMNAGVGAEVAATIQEKAFLSLEAPVKRVAGWATHTGLMFEQFIIPDVIRKQLNYTSLAAPDRANDFRRVRCHQADIRLLNRKANARREKHISATCACC
jgi:2-oxoisovalerate dehydrogenase E1 component beta subunit